MAQEACQSSLPLALADSYPPTRAHTHQGMGAVPVPLVLGARFLLPFRLTSGPSGSKKLPKAPSSVERECLEPRASARHPSAETLTCESRKGKRTLQIQGLQFQLEANLHPCVTLCVTVVTPGSRISEGNKEQGLGAKPSADPAPTQEGYKNLCCCCCLRQALGI